MWSNSEKETTRFSEVNIEDRKRTCSNKIEIKPLSIQRFSLK